MHKVMTEIGLVLQVLAVIPPGLNALRSDRDVYDREVGVPVASRFEPSKRDRIAIVGGFALVAAGGLLQWLAVYLSQ